MNEAVSGGIEVDLLVDGIVNGSHLRVIGRAEGKTGGGRIIASVHTETELPDGFQLGLLPYVLITGQPSLSENLPGADNPFVRTGGAYRAVRTLDLGGDGALRTEYEVSSSGDNRLLARFYVEGSVRVPRLRRILPTVETWTPVRTGEHRGTFPIVWETETGSFLNGYTATQYLLPDRESLKSVTFRCIRIDIEDRMSELSQKEYIVVLPERSFAAALLAAAW